jgi:hypothetical protein
MKKLKLFNLVLVVATALSLYAQATLKPMPSTAFTCPSICPHLLCGNGNMLSVAMDNACALKIRFTRTWFTRT